MSRPKPIFIIGSYRSATSALTWAIGQHPNIFPLEETNFLARMMLDLGVQHMMGSSRGARTFLSSARISRRAYYQHFVPSIDKLIMDSRSTVISESRAHAVRAGISSANVELTMSQEAPKSRWVDGTPLNSHYVLPLRMMFPDAKFIFVLRDPRQVARSLAHFESIGGGTFSEQDAYNRWLSLVKDCALAERAFGSSVVLRLRYEDIRDTPEAAVRRCLGFVEEPFDSACLNPLRQRINASVIPPNAQELQQGEPPQYVAAALALYNSLSSGEFERTFTPLRALRTLASSVQQQVRAIESENMQALLKKHRALMWRNRHLSIKLSQAEEQLEKLRSVSGVRSLVRRVRRAIGDGLGGR